MFNKKIKLKTKKILSTIVALNILMINMSSLAFAGELTASDLKIQAEVNAGTATKATANDIVSANKLADEESTKKAEQQQTNATSTNSSKTYTVSRDGKDITMTENACYESTQSSCTQTIPVYTKDNNGNTSVSYQPSNTVQYTVSDGGTITPDMLSQLGLQKDLEKGTNTSNIVSTTLTAAASQLKNLPFAQRIAALALIYQQAQATQQAQEFAATNKTKAQTALQTKEAQLASIQKKYKTLDVNGSGSSRFDVILNPTIPTNTDGQDVTITLKPKKEINSNDFNVTATFMDITKSERVNLDVTEKYKKSTPFIVELGLTKNRTVGERKIIVIYKSKDGTINETTTIVYNVTSYQNALIPTGETVSNSVMGSVANGDLAALDGTTLAVTGKIISAKWDDSTQICSATLSDAITSNNTDDSKIPSVTIQSSPASISKDKCESNIGNYAAFNEVSASYDANGQIVFKDIGTTATSAYGITQDQYFNIESADAAIVQQATGSSYDIPVVRYDSASGEYVESLAGTQGMDWTQISGPSGVSMVSVYKDGNGEYQIGKVTGTPYSKEELSDISSTIGIDLSQAKISTDDNGMVVISSDNGKVVNNNNGFSQEYYVSQIEKTFGEASGANKKYDSAAKIMNKTNIMSTSGTIITSNITS